MASVHELLAAAQAQKSPVVSLLEDAAQGFGSTMENPLERMKTYAALQAAQQDRQQKMENMKLLQGLLSGQQDQRLSEGLQAAGGPVKPVAPGPKLSSITLDKSGYPQASFKVVEPAKLSQRTYLTPGPKGEERLGAFNPDTGQTIASPTDLLAPKQPNTLALSEKQSQFDQKRLTALGDALDPSKQRMGAFGVSKQVYDRAERLKSLVSAFPDGNLDSRQIEEVAIGLNAMLSGSNTGAQAQVKALVPNSIIGNAQKLKEWLVNDPQGTNQQAFVQRMMGSIEREQATAADQIKRTQFQRIARYADLQKRAPDEFLNVIQAAGIDPAEYVAWQKGGYKPMSAVQGAEAAGSGGIKIVGVRKR